MPVLAEEPEDPEEAEALAAFRAAFADDAPAKVAPLPRRKAPVAASRVAELAAATADEESVPLSSGADGSGWLQEQVDRLVGELQRLLHEPFETGLLRGLYGLPLEEQQEVLLGASSTAANSFEERAARARKAYGLVREEVRARGGLVDAQPPQRPRTPPRAPLRAAARPPAAAKAGAGRRLAAEAPQGYARAPARCPSEGRVAGGRLAKVGGARQAERAAERGRGVGGTSLQKQSRVPGRAFCDSAAERGRGVGGTSLQKQSRVPGRAFCDSAAERGLRCG
eukprot:CAMPEP_0179128360 /NCGR_PEP_ID=MMETSP0796-20121207/60855_1 /TAXON_ID=73915 /ORGANISM="Pyrodinium bahamense, Strain pbaha01" /LENGTH=281 /DNA_ID=CAMNT_0020827199 /DNA_START=51 /DNA_END=895 /DNA_ORIENTATION=+